MKLAAAELAIVSALRLYIIVNCDGPGTLVNHAGQFTDNGTPERIDNTLEVGPNLLVFTGPEFPLAALPDRSIRHVTWSCVVIGG